MRETQTKLTKRDYELALKADMGANLVEERAAWKRCWDFYLSTQDEGPFRDWLERKLRECE